MKKIRAELILDDGLKEMTIEDFVEIINSSSYRPFRDGYLVRVEAKPVFDSDVSNSGTITLVLVKG